MFKNHYLKERWCYSVTKEEANLHKGNYVYFARIIPKQGIYDVLDLKVRTVEDTYFVAQDSDKTCIAYPFAYKDVGVIIFKNRYDAVETVNNAEVNKPKVSDETYYEEY